MSVDNTTIWGIAKSLDNIADRLDKVVGHLDFLPAINEHLGVIADAVKKLAPPDNSDILIRRAGMTIPQFREQLRGLGVPWADTMEITPEMRKDIEEGTDWESTTELLNSEEYQALSEQVYGPEVK